MVVSELGVVTTWPLTERTTFAGARPSDCAAVSHKTPRMSAPGGGGRDPARHTRRLAVGHAARPGLVATAWVVTAWFVTGWVAAGPPLARGLLPRVRAVALATSTPRKPGRPMYTVALDWPAAIFWAMARAVSIGMAKPIESPGCPSDGVFAAVTIPMTWPALFASAPPESPCWIWALVCSMWFRSSVLPEPWSVAWMERFSPLM